jgi:hypothetical protein
MSGLGGLQAETRLGTATNYQPQGGAVKARFRGHLVTAAQAPRRRADTDRESVPVRSAHLHNSTLEPTLAPRAEVPAANRDPALLDGPAAVSKCAPSSGARYPWKERACGASFNEMLTLSRGKRLGACS